MLRTVSLVLLACTVELWAADTVTVTPTNPTFRDSLSFDLYNEARCCVTQYYGDTVLVNDTTIVLSYEYDDTLCPYVQCLLPGSHHEFATGPVAAGTYGIYKMESMYCPPGRICPLGPIVMRRVGEVTVSRPNAVSGSPAAIRATGQACSAALRFEPAARRVVVGTTEGAFRLDGVRIGQQP
jgi:hypothetical protein